MPTFHRHAPNRPDISFANLDKIRIRVNRAYSIRFQSDDDYNGFKRALGQSDVFSQGNIHRSSTFKVRKRVGNLGERWLFGGGLQFRRNSSLSGAGVVYMGVLDLELNSSRFINHFVENYRGIVADENFHSRVSEYTVNSRPHEILERSLYLPESAFGLDGNDNLIPRKVFRYARPVLGIFDPYFAKVLEFIRQKIEMTLASVLTRDRYELTVLLEDWNISYAEVYWEYSASNAVAFINGLRGHLLPMFQDTEIVHYHAPAETVVRNCPSLRVNLGIRGVDLVVYAKTFDRVRFEVRYKDRVREKITQTNGLTFPECVTRGAGVLLQLAIENAQERLHRVFERIPDLDYEERCSFQAFVEFLSNLAEVCHEAGIHRNVRNMLSLLASNGGISVRLNSEDHVFCEALRGRRILSQVNAARNERGNRRYALNPQYATVIRAMLAELE
jgi:hypothetical protein